MTADALDELLDEFGGCYADLNHSESVPLTEEQRAHDRDSLRNAREAIHAAFAAHADNGWRVCSSPPKKEGRYIPCRQRRMARAIGDTFSGPVVTITRVGRNWHARVRLNDYARTCKPFDTPEEAQRWADSITKPTKTLAR